MTEEAQEQLHAIVFGRVQGVNFRYFTIQEAARIGVVGWVRNRADDTVEVLAEGTRAQLEQLIHFLHRGSPSAYVEQVDVTWRKASGEFSDFTVRYGTAG